MTTSSVPIDSAARFDRIVKWLAVGEPDSRWIQTAFILASLLYLTFLGAAGTGPINEYGHDVFLLLDGGWRILNGQVPYRDFYLSLGPLEYMITAFGMLLTQGSTQGIAIGNIVFGAVAGIWGWLLSRRRMPAIPALLVAAWLILTATLPTPLGLSPQILSCAMIYNRHGYALLGIVLVECAFASERSRFWGGASSGIALALTAFLKLNFFGVAGLLLLATIPLRREEMPRAWGIVMGLAGTVAVFLFYLRFAISAFLYDMQLTIQARSSRLAVAGEFGFLVGNPRIVTVAVVTLLTILLITRGRLWQRSSVRILLLGGAVLATSVLFIQTNCADSGDKLIFLWEIVLVGALGGTYARCKEKVAVATVMTLCLGGVFSDFFMDAESVRTLVHYQSASVRSQGISISHSGMDRLRFYELNQRNSSFVFDNGHSIVEIVNDGLTMLEDSSKQTESVLTLGFIEPFAYILRRRPALGGSPWLVLGDNFPTAQSLNGSLVFGNADLLMLPHYPSSNMKSDADLAAAYHPYIVQHFDFVASSQWWSLYRRKR
jgi:hypothetical protein